MGRLWRTGDGDLVEDGHPDARTLAYGDDDDVPTSERVRSAAVKVKKAVAPKNKKAPAPDNKGA